MDSYPQRLVTMKLGTEVPFLSMVFKPGWSSVFLPKVITLTVMELTFHLLSVIYPGRGGVLYS